MNNAYFEYIYKLNFSLLDKSDQLSEQDIWNSYLESSQQIST
jgi:hypothetical protein